MPHTDWLNAWGGGRISSRSSDSKSNAPPHASAYPSPNSMCGQCPTTLPLSSQVSCLHPSQAFHKVSQLSLLLVTVAYHVGGGQSWGTQRQRSIAIGIYPNTFNPIPHHQCHMLCPIHWSSHWQIWNLGSKRNVAGLRVLGLRHFVGKWMWCSVADVDPVAKVRWKPWLSCTLALMSEWMDPPPSGSMRLLCPYDSYLCYILPHPILLYSPLPHIIPLINYNT